MTWNLRLASTGEPSSVKKADNRLPSVLEQVNSKGCQGGTVIFEGVAITGPTGGFSGSKTVDGKFEAN